MSAASRHAAALGARIATWVAAATIAASAPAFAATATGWRETPASATASRATPGSAQALYQEAEARLATRKSEDLERALDLFLDAARLDPSHARAHAGAATAASLLALYSVAPPRPLFVTARAEAEAALRLDPGLAAAEAAMGLIEYLDGWDFRAAEARLREALRLDPGYARAWHWYGMMLMATQRFDESLAAFDRAIAIEPESGLYRAKRAGVLAAAGRDGEAEHDLRDAVDRFPQSALAQRELGYLLVGAGKGEEGVAALRRAAELSGTGEDESADLAWGYARTGRREDALAIAARLVERSRTAFVSPLDPALVYAALGRVDDALHWLEAAVDIRDPGLVYLATAPGWESLRGDARFDRLLQTIGLRHGGSPDDGGAGATTEKRSP